ncbi:uncharacterized protein NEMAJ01_0340 [Nematocida major]|uniref:uncharacterized protein n=1 Tax=Nematocida major TaxID=1912982 RepID=UPI002007DA42|nr:uncharacterized protein NEMAJ01_0340 [Nematocida major]KAH9385444.1 hypothetical protein NEMAJ01_0340 [Nematocida major]
MRKKEHRVHSRAFSALAKFAEASGLDPPAYDYSFLSEVPCAQSDRKSLVSAMKELEGLKLPYRVVQDCILYVASGRKREISRLCKRSSTGALFVCRGLLSAPVPAWHASLIHLFRCALSCMEDKPCAVEAAVTASVSIEEALGTPIHAQAEACIARQCSASTIIAAITSLIARPKSTKYLAGLVCLVYPSEEGQRFYESLSDWNTEASALLHIHATERLFRARTFNSLNSATVLGGHIERLLLAERWAHPRAQIADARSGLPHKHKLSRVHAGALHFLEVSFRLRWISERRAAGLCSIVFGIFEKTKDIRAARALSYIVSAAPLRHKDCCSVYINSILCHVAYLLGNEGCCQSGHFLRSASIVVQNLSACSSLHMFGFSEVLALLNTPSPHRAASLLSKLIHTPAIVGSLFEQICDNVQILAHVVRALSLAGLCVPDSLAPKYLSVVQSIDEKTWETLEPCSMLLAGILPDSIKAVAAAQLLSWACERFPAHARQPYLYGLISGCCPQIHARALLESAASSILLQINSCSSIGEAYSALSAVVMRALSLDSQFEDAPVFSEIVFSFSTWIGAAEPASLPSIYAFALKANRHAYGWKEWDNAVLAAVHRLPALASSKSAHEADLVGEMCSCRILEKVVRKLMQYAEKKKIRPSAVRSLQALCVKGRHHAAVLGHLHRAYMSARHTSSTAILRSVGHVLVVSTECGMSCVDHASLLVSMCEEALRSSFPSVRRAGLFLAKCAIENCWGCAEGYRVAVHLLNCSFPFILDPKAEAGFFGVLQACAERLTLEVVTGYILPGMVHTDKSIRSAHRKAYAHVTGQCFQREGSASLDELSLCMYNSGAFREVREQK